MRRTYLTVVKGLLSLVLLSMPSFISGTSKPVTQIPAFSDTATIPEEHTPISEAQAAGILYDSLNLSKIGLSKEAFIYALKGYTSLEKKGLLNKKTILSICDFSQSSRKKRLYIIDIVKKKLVLNTYVAHGRNSGSEYAKSFSNSPESLKSSLGFYVTGNTYQGGHGLSLKIDGVDKGFNDKANERNIVVHGSDYVGTQFLRNNQFIGRSFGCPAVPLKETSFVINTIKDGTCLFIYHPSDKYIRNSRILNS